MQEMTATGKKADWRTFPVLGIEEEMDSCTKMEKQSYKGKKSKVGVKEGEIGGGLMQWEARG